MARQGEYIAAVWIPWKYGTGHEGNLGVLKKPRVYELDY